MTRLNRRDIVSRDESGIYHCYSRCAAGAYLCGTDRLTGENYDHRKGWIVERLGLLATVFSLELLGNAVLDNHMHQVLRTRPDLVEKWSSEEVVRRWFRLHPPKSERGKVLEVTDDLIAGAVKNKHAVLTWRERLGSLSWYMKELKEVIAKRANRESGRTGAFFDSHFKSPRLADPVTLLICLMYLDLNPLRAKMVEQPEQYEYCSYRLRAQAHQLRHTRTAQVDDTPVIAPDAYLQPIPEEGEPGNCTAPHHRPSDKGILPMTAAHYLALVDWAGRQHRHDKRGKIPEELAPVLDRLGIAETLVESTVLYEHLYRRAGTQVKLPAEKRRTRAAAA